MKKTREKIEITRDVFEEKCKYCNKVVKGTSESAVKFKMESHVDKHRRKGEIQ